MFLIANVGKTTDHAPLQTVIKLTFVANFGFICNIVGGCDGFSAVSMVASYDLGRVGDKNKTNNCMLCCTILMQFDLE